MIVVLLPTRVNRSTWVIGLVIVTSVLVLRSSGSFGLPIYYHFLFLGTYSPRLSGGNSDGCTLQSGWSRSRYQEHADIILRSSQNKYYVGHVLSFISLRLSRIVVVSIWGSVLQQLAHLPSYIFSSPSTRYGKWTPGLSFPRLPLFGHGSSPVDLYLYSL